MFTLYAYVVDIQKVANIIHICEKKSKSIYKKCEWKRL